MVVKSLIKDKNNNYTVILDNNKEYKMHEETIVKYRIVPSKEITQEELDAILKTNRSEEGFIKALIHIQKYPKSKKDMITYLESKEYFEEEISYIISRLEELKLIDDLAYANMLRDYNIRKSYGLHMLRHKLIEKHIPYDIIEESLKGIDYQEYNEYLHKLINKNINKYSHKINSKQCLVKYIYSRGYYYEEINRALEELGV